MMELQELFRLKRYAEVRGRLEKILPAWVLSPRAYWLGASAARYLGDTQAAELDRFLYQTCLQGILNTGQGTRRQPYWITYASDEPCVLAALGSEARTTRLIRMDSGLCDVVRTGTRRQLWFVLGEGVRDEGASATTRTRVRKPVVR
jgi:hypothetical protein